MSDVKHRKSRREIARETAGREIGGSIYDSEPEHQPALGTSDADDVLLAQHLQGDGVNALLVDDSEALTLVADLLLELNDPANSTTLRLP